MSEAQVLVVDCSGSDLSRTLRTTLESSVGLQLRCESIEASILPSYQTGFSGTTSTFHPDLICFVFAASSLRCIRTLFDSMRAEYPAIPVLTVIEADEPDEMFETLKLGADDFITPPLRAVDLVPRIWRLLAHRGKEDRATCRLKERLGLRQLVGQSPGFLAEVKKIPLVAKCDASILISGETGTGKELCARAIHYLSLRTAKPFVPVNCGAIPTELVENELFGHQKGAFTGASTRQRGLIDEADGGTLFLDEVDCLPLVAQVKLLRFLQAKEYRPLGSGKVCQADVRIIAAANTNLADAVTRGRLRQDLFYRLNIIPVLLPPLRERRDDIPLLARHFLDKYASAFNKGVTDFSSEAMQTLLLGEWPGNVRELENVVERAVVFCEESIVQNCDVVLTGSNAGIADESFQTLKARVILQFEKTYIHSLLLAHKGNISRAAKAAQKNRRSFWQLIRKHRINVQGFKASEPASRRVDK
jgi:two-component system, NtrC family, response regulator GlrR